MKPWARHVISTVLILNVIAAVGQMMNLFEVPTNLVAYAAGFGLCGLIAILGTPVRRPATKVTVKANEVKNETKSL